MENLVRRVQRIEDDLYSVDGETPGVLLKLDRIIIVAKLAVALGVLSFGENLIRGLLALAARS